MQYMLLVYESERWNAQPIEEKYRVHDACWAWHDQLVKSGQDRGAAGLKIDTATRVSETKGAIIVTDGPYAETKEVLGGYQTVECSSWEEAVALARTFPGIGAGCSIEVRQVLDDRDLRREYKDRA